MSKFEWEKDKSDNVVIYICMTDIKRLPFLTQRFYFV